MLGSSKQGNCNTPAQLRRMLLVGTALTGAFITPVGATAYLWTPPAGNDWFLSGNWTPAGPPTNVAGDQTNITASATVGIPAIISQAGAVSATINIDRANTLTVTGAGVLNATNINISTSSGGSRFQVLAGGSATFSGTMLVGNSTSAVGNNVLVDGVG